MSEEVKKKDLSVLDQFDDINSIQTAFFDYLDALIKSNTNEKIINLIHSIKECVLNYFYLGLFEKSSFEPKSGVSQISVDILESLHHINEDLLKENFTDTENLAQLKPIVADMTQSVILHINFISFRSINYCCRFIEFDGLKSMFYYISNEFLIDKYVEAAVDTNSLEFNNLDNILRRIMGCLVCIARAYSNYKNEWKQCDSAKNFLNYHRKTKHILDNAIYSCLAVAYVADDEDIDNLPDLTDVIPDIARLIGEAGKMIKEDPNPFRYPMTLDDESTEQKEVALVGYMDTNWSIINLIKALYHLSVNDKLKHDIYYKCKMNEYLRTIVYHGNEVEKEYSLLLVWQLCFDKQIAQDVFDEKEFYEFIKNISVDKSLDKKLVKNAAGILWIIDNKLSDQSPFSASKTTNDKPADSSRLDDKKPEEDQEKQQHILISYNKESKDLCLKLKAELEKSGFKVWIDLEESGSLQSMANAVENCFCVLMCMTEKYKQSPNCRAEAEYAFQLYKPIIPLIMQKDYKADGWLGIILGSKIFVNFMKYDFEECIKRTMKELSDVLKEIEKKKSVLNVFISNSNTAASLGNLIGIKDIQAESKSEKTKNEAANLSSASEKVLKTVVEEKIKELNWSEGEVDKWLAEKKIHPKIGNSIRPCDGKMLSEYYLIKKESPDFFYRSLALHKPVSQNNSDKNNTVMVRDIALFTQELKKLFKL